MQGINVTGLSASADSLWDECEQKYFITYGLKYRDDGNLKTVMGSVTHKVLEILAKAKKALDSGSKVVNDEVLGGDYAIDMLKWMRPSTLTSVELEHINNARAEKSVYKYDCQIKEGHSRKGVEFVENIISLCYAWYSNKYTQFAWDKDANNYIRNWVWMALEYQNGLYDPRNKKIIATEFAFESEIKADWAKYNYTFPDGTQKEGYLKLRGVIDLVVDAGDGVYEIIDWKTGQRKDWSTGKIKDYESLQKDRQLMIYYYAARQLFTEAKDVILTIFFVRDGGPFSIPFDKGTIIKVEQHLRKQFRNIKNCETPKLLSNRQSHFKCKRFCPFFKLQKDDKNLCAYVHEQVKLKGIEQVHKDFFQEKQQNELCATKV
jgi:hypothetical protein